MCHKTLVNRWCAHAQICPRIIMCSASHALIVSVELATKILRELERELACMSCEAPRFLALDRVFDNSSLLVRFRCLRVRSNLPLYVRSTCLCSRSQSPQRWPRIAVKGISLNNFRPERFYRTPHMRINAVSRVPAVEPR